MTTSILNDTKRALNLAEANTDFDGTILMHINSVFSVLKQLGVGPTLGFMIEDDTSTWDDFLETDLGLNSAKSLMYMRVRLMFDPPQTGPQMESLNKMIAELEWRLNVERETIIWTPPVV